MESEGNRVEREDRNQKRREYLQGLLLDAASRGEGITTPLLVGGVEVRNEDYPDITFEETRHELHELIDEGLIRLDSQYRPHLTDKGIEVAVE